MDLFLKHHFIAMKQRTQNYNEISCIEILDIDIFENL